MKGRLILTAALVAVLFTTLVVAAGAARGVRRGYMRGAVTRSGSPVRSAWVIVTQGGGEKGRSPTGDDGGYYIGELDDGEYDVTVVQGPRRASAGHVRLPENSIYNIKDPLLR